jgi:small subunit ribosomal protein S16e
VAHATPGRGLVRLNGQPIALAEPALLRYKLYEPILVIGQDKIANMDIRLKVKGGGHTSQIYAIRQAIGKAIVAVRLALTKHNPENGC